MTNHNSDRPSTTLATYLRNDHRAVVARFRGLRTRIDGKEPVESLIADFESIADDSVAHFEVEESAIFPLLLAEGSPADQDSVASLQADHFRLRSAIAHLRACCRNRSGEIEAFREFHDAFLAHQGYEERLLYPVFESLCPPALLAGPAPR